MKTLLKRITPKWFLSLYHYCFAVFANLVYGIPSRKMLVIGITGTKGKTSTANFVWSVLQKSGIKTGIISTANIRVGEVEEENNFHMTMPGRFFVQKTLSRMVKAGCEVAIVETTSQGIVQFRHIGVQYDVAIFTNLTPEHIESHGSFENYKLAKGKMFEALSTYKQKVWRGKRFLKTIIANSDDQSSSYFLNFKSEVKKTFSMGQPSDYKATDVELKENATEFSVNGAKYKISIPGFFNIYNALPAIVVGELVGLSQDKIATGLCFLDSISGRLEEVYNVKGFRVFVDYAHEPAGLQSVIEVGNNLKLKEGKTIVLVGCAGGGRDKARRSVMGNVAGKYSDVVVVSDDEPYEEDPKEILNEIKKGAIEAGKIEGENLFVIGDRREGIKKALSLAKSGDAVIFTGLGHQKVRMIGKEAVEWVERVVVEEELKKLYE